MTSSKRLPTIWNDSGSPAPVNPQQTDIAGAPVTLNGIVRLGRSMIANLPTSSMIGASLDLRRLFAPPGLPETCQRGGHIPGAKSIPWGKNCNDDGTFKSFDDLRALYAEKGITGDQPVIAYCRIGERSSLTWFAMKYLLGFDNVKNYDGSWTEWGNLVGAAVEKP